MVTADQVARHFFDRDKGKPAAWAAYRRLAALSDLGLIVRDRVVWKAPEVIRVTIAGARVADVGVGPAHLVIAEVYHATTVVSVTEALLPENLGAQLTTEREIRVQRLRDRREGAQATRGRLPDAELRLKSGKRIGIEVDVTSKRTKDVERIIRDYRYSDERYDKVWWFAQAGRVAERIRTIVKENQAADFIEVREWQA
jgi:hypothetical protein